MLHNNFLNADAHGILEKLVISLTEFQLNSGVPCLRSIFSVAVSDTDAIVDPYPEILCQTLAKSS